MSGIFISYRHDDAKPYASRLCEHLSQRFDEREVFLDKKIQPGDDFVRRIHERVDSCDVMLHLIGPRWLASRSDGTSRLDEPGDFVRLEIEYALEAGVRIIPVLVGDAEMPEPKAVPVAIRPFLRKHAHSIDDDHWQIDVETLDALLDKLLTKCGTIEKLRRRQRRRAPKRVYIAGLASVAALAAAAVAALAFSPEPEPERGEPVQRGIKAETFAIGDEPVMVAASPTGVWVARASGAPDSPTELIRVDQVSGKPIGEPIALAAMYPALAPLNGGLWVTENAAQEVQFIDGSTASDDHQPLDGTPIGIAADGDRIWVTTIKDDKGSGTLVGLDGRTGKPNGVRAKVGLFPWGVAAGEGHVWVANTESDSITRIDPEGGEPKSVTVRDGPWGIAVDPNGVWVANSADNSVSHFELDLTDELRIPVGESPQGIAIAQGSVWVANEGSDTVTRIDATTREVVGSPIKTGDAPTSVAADGEHVWVTNQRGDSLTRLTP